MDAWDIQPAAPVVKKSAPVKVEKPGLSESQKIIILSRWNDTTQEPPSIPELLELAFPNGGWDGRSKQAVWIKEFIVSKGSTIIDNKEEKKTIELTDEQKEYITNNCSNMKPFEMAKVIFNSIKIYPASLEVKKVTEFYRTLNPVLLNNEEIPDCDYRPPNTVERVVARIRKYIKEADAWDAKKLSPRQKKQVNALLGYLHAFRFKHQIDTYEHTGDKELFESSFIKYCYDKEDLTQEDIDIYILLCSEIVVLSSVDRRISMLQSEQDRVLEADGRMSMTVVEMVKSAGEERNTCVKRQESLYKSLTQERSKRLDEEIKDKATLLNLFNAWKNYDSRQKILKLREQQKDNLRKELHEIENMDELRQRVLGISIDQIVES